MRLCLMMSGWDCFFDWLNEIEWGELNEIVFDWMRLIEWDWLKWNGDFWVRYLIKLENVWLDEVWYYNCVFLITFFAGGHARGRQSKRTALLRTGRQKKKNKQTRKKILKFFFAQLLLDVVSIIYNHQHLLE